ncbi:peptidase inhibitor family I36 protein [Saccharothrix sp. BKS2]|uniref:peptidase inhibitor family I36 protein n=1 Tax=Saccharothrix sp. BKS2 TaxID=3064400 RepID=UPI0039E8818D
MKKTPKVITLSLMLLFLLSLQHVPASAADVTPSIRNESVGNAPKIGVGPIYFATCPASYSCFWTGLNETGDRWVAPSCGPWALGSVFNNNVESVRNGGGGTVHLYDAADSTNSYLRSVVNNGAPVNLESAYRNKASSIRIDC